MSGQKHSRLAPSSAFRWTDCTASVRFLKEHAAEISNDSSVYADEGTQAHEFLTRTLLKQPKQVSGIAEMDRIVTECSSYINGLMAGDHVTLLVDRKVPLFYLPSEKGTLDVAIIRPDRIYIIDLKYGAGVSVYAEQNKQLAIYGESLLRGLEQIEEFDANLPVHLVIYQPRDRSDPTVVREWVTTRGELSLFCETEIGIPAQQILDGHVGKFSPGEACKFCPAKGICTAYAARGLLALSDEPIDVVLAQEKIELPRVEGLTREQRQRVIGGRKVLERWLEAVEDQEMTELLAGAPAMSFKLVEGKSNRQWRDEESAKWLLRNHLTAEQTNPPSSLISPAQAEKLLKGLELSTKFDNKFASLVVKPPGKPSLVPVSDKRTALVLNLSEGLSAFVETEEII